MCGICVAIRDRGPLDPALIKCMCDRITHRGPDSAGYHVAGRVALGMRRLSIIDLNTGDQPIFNEDRSLAIVFNGEIYNFRDLRTRLLAKGHKFATASDTEVIVHLYEDLGVKAVAELSGMFAWQFTSATRTGCFWHETAWASSPCTMRKPLMACMQRAKSRVYLLSLASGARSTRSH